MTKEPSEMRQPVAMTEKPYEASIQEALPAWLNIERGLSDLGILKMPSDNDDLLLQARGIGCTTIAEALEAQREKDAQKVEKQFKDYVWCKQVAAAIRSAP